MNESIKDRAIYESLWPFQVRYAVGKVLNVGCNNDGAGFAKRGAINIDLSNRDECTGDKIPAHVLADARRLPFKSSSFDTVVLGEILEHLEYHDVLIAINQAKAVLRTAGRIVATIPHDNREPEAQGYGDFTHVEYASGVPRFHPREITRVEFFDWMKAAGLKIRLWARISHIWGKEGTGVVATC